MISLTEDINLAGFTAIIPCIGVGNVAQLATDLIIATLKLKRIGTGWHAALMPIFGPPAYQHDKSKTTSLELYCDEIKKLLVFQLRSPLVPSHIASFHKQIVDFITAQNLSKVIILSSSHAYEKHSVEGSSFEYIANDKFKDNYNESICKQSWTEFSGTIIHGGGNAHKLFKECTEKELPALLLFKFVSEGDNSPDASQLVSELNLMYDLFNDCKVNDQVKLVIPSSWNLLFGNEPPELIF